MKAEELRLGNLVQSTNPTGYILPVICQRIKDIDGGIGGYEPIPLTEEWLIKFGFYKYPHLDEGFKINLNEFTILGLNKEEDGSWHPLFKETFDEETWRESESVWCPYKINCVHQLQNLYFALTGKELIYT